jgi:hypothetical protein
MVLSANHQMTPSRDSIEAAGVEFTNGEQPGVRLRKAP